MNSEKQTTFVRRKTAMQMLGFSQYHHHEEFIEKLEDVGIKQISFGESRAIFFKRADIEKAISLGLVCEPKKSHKRRKRNCL